MLRRVLVFIACTLPTSAFAQSAGLGAGVSVGAWWLVLPGADAPGVASGIGSPIWAEDLTVFGPVASVGGAIELGRVGDQPLFLELQSYFAAGGGGRSASETLSGVSNLMLTSRTGASGAVNLSAGTSAAGASASAQSALNLPTGSTSIVASSGATPPGGGAQVSFGLNRGDGYSVLAAASTSTDPLSAAAYGALLDGNGLLIAATGDLTGTVVTSYSTASVTYGGLDLMLSAPLKLDPTWTLTPRLGPNYRHLSVNAERKTIVDFAEPEGLPDRMPLVGLSVTEKMDAHVTGLVAGIGLGAAVADRWTVSTGVEAGLALVHASLDSGATGLMQGSSPTALPGQSSSFEGASFIGRVDAGVSYLADNGTVFTLSGQIEHFSAMPVIRSDAPPAPGGTGTLTIAGPVQTATRIETVPLSNYSVSLAISRRF